MIYFFILVGKTFILSTSFGKKILIYSIITMILYKIIIFVGEYIFLPGVTCIILIIFSLLVIF